jgi:hypothetical protein
MAATFAQLAKIAGSSTFQQRVNYAMGVAAAAVYSELLTTNAVTAAGSAILHFATTTGIVAGMPVSDLTNAVVPAGATVLSTTATTVTISANVTGTGVAIGDGISFYTNHSGRAAFAIKVAQGNYNIQAACFAVLTNATIAAEAVNDDTNITNAIPDTDIQFSVNSLWNLLAGV